MSMTTAMVVEKARDLGWSDIQIAKEVGVSRETVRLARQGKREMAFSKGWLVWEIVRAGEKPGEE